MGFNFYFILWNNELKMKKKRRQWREWTSLLIFPPDLTIILWNRIWKIRCSLRSHPPPPHTHNTFGTANHASLHEQLSFVTVHMSLIQMTPQNCSSQLLAFQTGHNWACHQWKTKLNNYMLPNEDQEKEHAMVIASGTISLSLCDILKLCLQLSYTSRHTFFLTPSPNKRAGIACRLWVQTLAGVAGEFSFPQLSLCVDSYWASVPPLCQCSGM